MCCFFQQKLWHQKGVTCYTQSAEREKSSAKISTLDHITLVHWLSSITAKKVQEKSSAKISTLDHNTLVQWLSSITTESTRENLRPIINNSITGKPNWEEKKIFVQEHGNIRIKRNLAE